MAEGEHTDGKARLAAIIQSVPTEMIDCPEPMVVVSPDTSRFRKPPEPVAHPNDDWVEKYVAWHEWWFKGDPLPTAYDSSLKGEG